ncbi:hypothetical protein SAY87_022785 [Trapa incisa]|uniref:Uncharacterized protein n=1 Tax=Trapa incisa TaxID=236973 RepID=A0AAN7K4Q2_9MYRT|nr:hypothetical protein SAY87_022785 [Trapa incisa]
MEFQLRLKEVGLWNVGQNPLTSAARTIAEKRPWEPLTQKKNWDFDVRPTHQGCATMNKPPSVEYHATPFLKGEALGLGRLSIDGAAIDCSSECSGSVKIALPPLCSSKLRLGMILAFIV